MRLSPLLALLAACSGSGLYLAPTGTTDGTDPSTGETSDPSTVPTGTTVPTTPDTTTTPTEPDDRAGDDDGDGLTNGEEDDLGTDRDERDSDNDGFDDGDEVNGNTDPTDRQDHPYEGGWPIDACRDSLQPTGNNIGQITDDFALLDQNGEEVHLHDFCGKEVLLLSSAMWCGPCQQEAPDMQALYQEYEDRGFIVITLLGEDMSGRTPDQGDLQDWADMAGITHPVVADANWNVTARYLRSSSFSIPTMSLLGEGAEVLERDTWVSETTVRNNLP
jgi:peroxiredoxin